MNTNTTDGEKAAETPTRVVDEYHKFAKDIIWVGVAQLFSSVILGLGILPSLTKSYTPAIYGMWIQVNVTLDLMGSLLSLQLGLAAVKFLAGEEDKIKRRRFLGSMLFAIIIFSFLVSVFGVIFAKQLSVLLFASSEYVHYIWLAIAWIFINTVYNFLQSYLQARRKNRELSIIQIVITSAKVLFIVGLAISRASLSSIIISQIALQSIFSIVILLLIKREMGFPVLNLNGLKTFLAYSTPQIPVIIFLWVMKMSDRFFITHLLGLSQESIYSASIVLAGLASLFFMPVSFVLFSLMSKLWAQGKIDDVKSYFDYSLRLFLTLAIPGVVGISLLSQPILKLISTSQFLAGKELVFLATLGILFLGIFQMNINLLLLDKRSKLLPLITAIGAVTNIVVNIIFIPKAGIIGGALSSCVSYLVLALVSGFWARKILRFNINLKYYGKVLASTLVMFICLYFLKINGVLSIIVAAVLGTIIFFGGLMILRTFSKQDYRVARNIFSNL